MHIEALNLKFRIRELSILALVSAALFVAIMDSSYAHSNIALRAEGSAEASVSEWISPNTAVAAVLYVGKFWNKIKMVDGTIGWIKKSEMSSLRVPTENITILKQSTELRAQGRPNASVTAELGAGTVIIQTLYRGRHWDRVVTNHGTGWIRKSALQGHSHESVFQSQGSDVNCSVNRNLADLASSAEDIQEIVAASANNGDENRMGWISPVKDQYCRIGSKFGMRTHPITRVRQMHTGMDLPRPRGGASQSGHPIVAPFDGTVISTGPNGNCGNYLRIKSTDGEYEMGFCHLQGVSSGIREGVRVEKGQSVARIGSTGLSTGPHAHIIVYRNGVKVDPLNYYTESQLCK